MVARKLVKYAVAAMALLMSGSVASAQTAAQAMATFEQLVGGADKNKAYSALYNAYTANKKQLESAPKGSDRHNEAYSNLLRMWPYLENAAIHFSSARQQSNATFMAQAYLEMPKMDEFRHVDFNYSHNRGQLAYFVASRYFNNRDYAKSIPFLQEYLLTGEEKNRKNVFTCLIKACTESGNKQLAAATVEEAIAAYPNDWNLLSMAINACHDSGNHAALQKYLDKARAIRPNDPTVLNIQAELYEDTQQFDKAIEVYLAMLRANPNSLEVNKHLGLNYYNAGALCSNKAMLEQDAKQKKKLQAEAKSYFQNAVPVLERVVGSEVNSVKYNTALGVAYSQTDNAAKLERQNQKLASLGVGRVSAADVPQTMAFAKAGAASAGGSVASASSSVSVPQSSVVAPSAPSEAPSFSAFAKEYIESRISKWQAKDPYETADEYRSRVTEQARDAKVKELRHEAEENYLSMYATGISPDMFKLCPYDAENEVFLLESSMGQLLVPVPRANNEARLFEQNWKGVSLKDPKFFIANDALAIAELTFVMPTGKNYKYSDNQALTYVETNVDVSFDAIDYSGLAQNTKVANKPNIARQDVKVGQSDVDVNIPQNPQNKHNTFALIIANENYSMVTKVPMAINDGSTFRQYCEKTLGIPAQNIIYCQDASYGVMLSAIKQIKDIAQAYKDDEFDVIFYYAGHGIPNEATKDGYLLPTDANGQQTEVCYPLSKLYGELGELNAKQVLVFLDACFSGAEREGGMLASARGVALRAKPSEPKGNMVVFSAATGDETAFPYKEKGHGMFTYFLLKKLQESKGNVTLNELGEYVKDNVRKQSVVINHKSQTPTVSASGAISHDLDKRKLY